MMTTPSLPATHCTCQQIGCTCTLLYVCSKLILFCQYLSVENSQFFIMRSDRMQIALVLAGLLLACISAALILAMAIPSTETVVEGVFHSAQGVAGGLQTRLEQEMGSFRVHKMLRGQIHRRLDEVVSVVRFSSGPSSL
jgi:hypothetical protein